MRNSVRFLAFLTLPLLVVISGFALYTLTLYGGRCPGTDFQAFHACSAAEYLFSSMVSPAALAAHTVVLGAWLVLVVLTSVLTGLVRCSSQGCRR